jgi:hypothetical protein
MLTLFSAHRAAALISALCVAACGGALLIVPLFEFGFNSADNSVGLFIFPAKPTAESGNFDTDGVRLSINPGSGSVTTVYNGSYSGCGFELKASGTVTAPAAAAYSGRFTSKDTIELRRPGESAPSYTLARLKPDGVPATPDFGC